MENPLLHELAVLSGAELVFVHAIERIITEIENVYCRNYVTQSDYKRLCSAYGKAQADTIIREQSKRILRQQDALWINRLLQKAKEFHQIMEHTTELGMKVVETDEMTALESLQTDANDILRMYFMFANCKQDEKTDKEIEDFILSKYDHDKPLTNQELIERFRLR